MSLSHTIAKVVAKRNLKVEDVISVLKKYNLLSLLPSVIRVLKQMHKEESLRESIIIESPFDINSKGIEAIKNIVGDVSVQQKITINKNLLAGFTAQCRGKLYDGSAERIIRQLLMERRN